MTKPRILFANQRAKLLSSIRFYLFAGTLVWLANGGTRAANSVLTPLWQIAPGDRPYLSSDTIPTGMAYNSDTDDLLLVAGTSGNRIIILDGTSANEKGRMYTDSPIISGGDSTLNAIGVTDDGTIYAANLVSDSSMSNFSVYRWDNEGGAAVPSLVFSDDPSSADADPDNRRFGDTMAVRGLASTTQILVGPPKGNVVAILTNPDGFRFFGTTIQADAPKGAFGQGLTFGDGNTFWAKGADGTLRLLDFDMGSLMATTRVTIANTTIPTNFLGIAYDKGAKLLAGVTLDSHPAVQVYDFNDLSHPRLADQGIFPATSTNRAASIITTFGVGRFFALDSNQGLAGFGVSTNSLGVISPAQLAPGSLKGTNLFHVTLTGSAFRDYRVESTVDFHTWTPISTVTSGADGSASITDSVDATHGYRFYRAVHP